MVMGANIGACVSAVLAVTGNAAALQVAFIHRTYNFLAVLIIYGLPISRMIPVRTAEALGIVAAENIIMALAYILAVFFIIPGLYLLQSSLL